MYAAQFRFIFPPAPAAICFLFLWSIWKSEQISNGLFRYGMQQTGIQLGTLQLYGMHLYHQATRTSTDRRDAVWFLEMDGWKQMAAWTGTKTQ